MDEAPQGADLSASLSFFSRRSSASLAPAQMTGWRRSGVGKALALLALAFPLWEWGGCWGLVPGELEPSRSSDPGPREVLHRPRRSWVWNQFFVLEEYTGNEPLYVGKVSETRPLTGLAVCPILATTPTGGSPAPLAAAPTRLAAVD